MAAVCDIRLLRLLALARPMQATALHQATGRCLSLSLEFALAAQQRHGITLQLVKWHVADDADYVDHWATLLDSGTVIDLTRVQVDGRTALTSTLDAYPANFTAQRVYPLQLLDDIYRREAASGTGRLSSRFLWTCGARLLRFDTARAWRQRDPALALHALREAARFAGCCLLDCLTQALQARADRLALRLQARPPLPARVEQPQAAGNPAGAGRAALSRRAGSHVG